MWLTVAAIVLLAAIAFCFLALAVQRPEFSQD
jgi:hypothetical protein